MNTAPIEQAVFRSLPHNKRPDFVVVAPPYSHQSGGVMVLHQLCSAINDTGRSCLLVFMHNGNATEQNFQYAHLHNPDLHMPGGHYVAAPNNTQELDALIQSAVVIYPDLITGNPLKAAKRCRYFLNVNEAPYPGEYLLSFSKLFRVDATSVLFKPFPDEHFHQRSAMPWHARTLDATYIGKGDHFTTCHQIEGSTLIRRDWPSTKRELADLLRQVRYFYTWDTVSSTNQDAIRCGAVPVLMHDHQIPRAVLNTGELGPYPDLTSDGSGRVTFGQGGQSGIDCQMSAFNDKYDLHSRLWPLSVELFIARVEAFFSPCQI